MLEGVGDTPSLKAPLHIEDDDVASDASSDGDVDLDTSWADFLDSSQAQPDRDLSLLGSWALACVRTVRALQDVRQMQSGRKLGDHRSISFVYMRPGKIDGCTCPADMPEVLWGHLA